MIKTINDLPVEIITEIFLYLEDISEIRLLYKTSAYIRGIIKKATPTLLLRFLRNIDLPVRTHKTPNDVSATYTFYRCLELIFQKFEEINTLHTINEVSFISLNESCRLTNPIDVLKNAIIGLNKNDKEIIIRHLIQGFVYYTCAAGREIGKLVHFGCECCPPDFDKYKTYSNCDLEYEDEIDMIISTYSQIYDIKMSYPGWTSNGSAVPFNHANLIHYICLNHFNILHITESESTSENELD